MEVSFTLQRKSLYACAVLIALGLIALLIVYARRVPITVSDARIKSPSRRSIDKPQTTPVPSEPRSAIAAESSRLLSWKEVPPRLAFFAPSLSPAGPEGGRRSWTILLSTLLRNRRFGADPLACDRELRAAGLVASLDYFVLKSAGLEPGRVKFETGDLIPFCPESRVALPEDAERVRLALLNVIEQPGGVVSTLPAQFQSEDMGAGVRCRALLLLATLFPSKEVQDHLVGLRASGAGDSIRDAALAGLSLMAEGNSELEAQLVPEFSDFLENEEKSAILRNYRLRPAVHRTTGTEVVLPQLSTFRSLDQAVVQASIAEANSPSASLIAAMMPRLDNREIRERLLSILPNIQEPESIAILCQESGMLVGDPQYRAFIEKLLDSSEVANKLWGLSAGSAIALPDSLERAKPFLASEDIRFRTGGLMFLFNTCTTNPQGVYEAVTRVSDDPQLLPFKYLILGRARRYMANPPTGAAELQKSVESGRLIFD